MNYYIRGNKEKADQIKAAFEKLGVASNANRYNYKNDYVLYFSAGGMMHMIDPNGSWANIIKTHPDYKELELPVEPCFKVGDKIRSKLTQITYTINEIDIVNNLYKLDYCSVLDFKAQDKFELASKSHYDIANFKPFQKVLVRDRNNNKWQCAWFSNYDKTLPYPFITTGSDFKQCIPFDGNEHLLGTTDMCDEMYINW